ncbi:MAG TPA: N-acetyltransferase [Ardenticatenaceae bacterium]|nr:N-acetyltransferase [Ardenticatenaceae bacterium]
MMIRSARLADAPAITNLINRFAERGLMLPKSLVEVYEHLREFVVAEDQNGTIVGCGALRLMWHDLAEIRSLAIAEQAQGHGIGRRIVERLVDEAQTMGLARVFVLTYQEAFFRRLGFEVVVKQHFPQKVWADCRACPKRQACDEVAMVLVLDAAAAEQAAAGTRAAYEMLGLPLEDQIIPIEAIQGMEEAA